MLRQTRAKLLSGVTAVLVAGLAAVFSLVSNRPASRVPIDADADVAAGRAAYERLGCALCHSIGDEGTPGSALDGVGARRDAAALHAWITGAPPASDELPDAIASSKARYAGEPDLDALVKYLQTLRDETTSR